MKWKEIPKIWLALLLVSGGATLWFGSVTAKGFFDYFSLNRKVPAVVDEWMIEELPKGRFGIAARYHYSFRGQEYSAKTLFKRPYYLNPETAEGALPKWKMHSWSTWVSVSHPANATMQKLFPFQTAVHFLIAGGVLLYFLVLRRWAGAFQRTDQD